MRDIQLPGRSPAHSRRAALELDPVLDVAIDILDGRSGRGLVLVDDQLGLGGLQDE